MTITDEQLATAIVAKMAGMELKNVDSSTVVQPSTGPATKIDPKMFLPGVRQAQQSHEQAIINAANRAAEAAYPLPPPQAAVPQVPPQQLQQVPPQLPVDPNQLTFDFFDETTSKKTLKQLDMIVDYLYSINNKLDKLIIKRD